MEEVGKEGDIHRDVPQLVRTIGRYLFEATSGCRNKGNIASTIPHQMQLADYHISNKLNSKITIKKALAITKPMRRVPLARAI